MAVNGQVSVNISTTGDTIVIPAVHGVPISVISVILSLQSQTTVEFKSGSTSLSGPQALLALVLDENPGSRPWYTTANGEPFVISLGAATVCGGTLWYRQGAS